jgi:hypothetical protein
VATKTLETLVLPVLASMPVTMQRSGNSSLVRFGWKIYQATYIWRVVDHVKQQILALETKNIASVAPDDTDILQQINAVNDTCIGKFSIVDQGRLDYCLEQPYSQESTPAVFQHALFLALDTVAIHHEGWQQAAKVSVLSKDLHEAGLFDRIKDAFG